MAAKYSPAVQDAIREAVARGDRHSVALAKLRAGTLDPELGPVEMPARSFTYQWSRSKREQGRGGGAHTGPTVLQVLAVEIAIRDTGSDDPEQLAQASGYSLDLVREILALKAEADAKAEADTSGDRHTRAVDLVAERKHPAG